MEEIFELDQLTILQCKDLQFANTDSGYLSLTYQGKTYDRVNLTRLIPFQAKDEYISVSYEDEEKNFKEIGVIVSIKELVVEQYRIARDYLEFKYYMPEITKVHSIKDNNRGYILIKVDTNAGTKTLAIRDWYSNFKMLSSKMLYIVDADGNKYYAPDIYRLDKKSLYHIELFV